MCILRYRPATLPSGPIIATVLWYSPAARRSNSEATIVTPRAFATLPSASVLGPGIGSARSNRAASSFWQKYCERNSSGRQMTCAPSAAACSTKPIARARLSAGSVDIAIWTRPTVKVCFSRGMSIQFGNQQMRIARVTRPGHTVHDHVQFFHDDRSDQRIVAIGFDDGGKDALAVQHFEPDIIHDVSLDDTLVGELRLCPSRDRQIE